ELEITDAIQHLVESGREVRPSIVRGWWKDTGKKEDLLHANELILADLESEVLGDLIDCRVRGAIRVEPGARLIDCDITGPAVFGARASLARATVGPNTSIGDDCRIFDATIEGSIVLEGSEVHGWKVRDSLLGRGSRLHGAAPAGFVELTIGERSEIVGE
ncbi:MAG: glucose-1-phosphate thymidylyltransferase, partial [Acidimicrobiia bacterium]